MVKTSSEQVFVDDPLSGNIGNVTADNHQSLFQKINLLQATIAELQTKEKQLKDQHNETAKREAYLLTKLALKDKKIDELSKNIEKLKASACSPVIDQIYKCVVNSNENNPSDTTTFVNKKLTAWDATNDKTLYLTDPVVNVMFGQLKDELSSTQSQLEDIRMAYQMLSSQQPSDQLAIIKKLIAKCSLLQNENKYLAKQLTTGNHTKIQQQLNLTNKLNTTLMQKLEDTEKIISIQDDQLKKLHSLMMANQRLLANSDNLDSLL